MLGDEGHLTIPAGALDESILFEAVIDSDPITELADYTLLSSVYYVTPNGTNFALDATVRFNYLPATVGDALEEDIVIFTNQGSGVFSGTDILFARFDAVVDEDPVTPLQAETVVFGEWEMVWDDDSYSYTDYVTPAFLSLLAILPFPHWIFQWKRWGPKFT